MEPPPRPSQDDSVPEGSAPDGTYGERLALLTPRERELLDLAARGLMDEQIAQTLGLSISTINTYWVRVRNKVGQFSRTRIVGDLLRHQARVMHGELWAENARLRERLTEALERSHELLTTLSTLVDDPWPLHALAQLPDATLVTGPPATVVYANRAAHRLYRAGSGEIEGLPMHELTTAATPESLREPCRHLFAEDGPEEERIGLAEPYYARRRDGSNFRATARARRFVGRDGPLAVVTVRPFLGDVDAILKALRRPLGAI